MNLCSLRLTRNFKPSPLALNLINICTFTEGLAEEKLHSSVIIKHIYHNILSGTTGLDFNKTEEECKGSMSITRLRYDTDVRALRQII